MVAEVFPQLAHSAPAACSLRTARRHSTPISNSTRIPKRSLKTNAQAAEGDGEATCSGDGKSQPSIADHAEELMEADPVTREKLERVRKAAALVAELQAQRAALDAETTAANYASAWESQNQERAQAQRAAERGADADVLRAVDKLEQAQAVLMSAALEQQKWSMAVNEMEERVESAKAGALGGVAAAASSLPYLLATGGPSQAFLASLGTVAVSGALLGVTYRYAVRQDLGNSQLKSGVAGAFGLVRGLAQAEEILKPEVAAAGVPRLEALGGAAIAAGESMLTMTLAAVALDLAMRRGLLKPFGASDSSGAS